MSHRLPESYTEPEQYDPARFGRGEGAGRLALIGFGGGRHRCTGMSFAYNEMTVWLAQLLRRYELSLESAGSTCCKNRRRTREGSA